jgi:hypothetical protein
MHGGVMGMLGIGSSVHIADPNSFFDNKFAVYNPGPDSTSAYFTAHMDDGLSNLAHPLGAVEHLFQDIILPKLGYPRSKC